MTDEDGWDLFKDGDDFDVMAEGVLGDAAEIPFDPEQRRVFVVLNDTARTAVFGSAELRMAPGADGAWEGEVAHRIDLHMMPGEYAVVKLRAEGALCCWRCSRPAWRPPCRRRETARARRVTPPRRRARKTPPSRTMLSLIHI